jgi:hypothetical protein
LIAKSGGTYTYYGALKYYRHKSVEEILKWRPQMTPENDCLQSFSNFLAPRTKLSRVFW